MFIAFPDKQSKQNSVGVFTHCLAPVESVEFSTQPVAQPGKARTEEN